MNPSLRSLALAAVFLNSLANAHAEGPLDYPEPARQAVVGKTREQVRQELADAIRQGEIVSGSRGDTQADRYPGRFPQTQPAGKTREQVRRELVDAKRIGTVVSGRHGKTLAEQYPTRYSSVLRAEQVGQRN